LVISYFAPANRWIGGVLLILSEAGTDNKQKRNFDQMPVNQALGSIIYHLAGSPLFATFLAVFYVGMSLVSDQ